MGTDVMRITLQHKETVVSELIKCCADEIFIALVTDPVGCMFCNLSVMNVGYLECGEVAWVGDLRVLRAGVERAINTWCDALQKGKQADIFTLVRMGVADELRERRGEKIKRLRSRKPEELLPDLLALVHRNPVIAAVLLNHLTPDQLSDLKVLLHDQISDKPAIYLRMNSEPKEAHRWLLWYLYHSGLCTPCTNAPTLTVTAVAR
jgi:hypothetical protein